MFLHINRPSCLPIKFGSNVLGIDIPGSEFPSHRMEDHYALVAAIGMTSLDADIPSRTVIASEATTAHARNDRNDRNDRAISERIADLSQGASPRTEAFIGSTE